MALGLCDLVGVPRPAPASKAVPLVGRRRELVEGARCAAQLRAGLAFPVRRGARRHGPQPASGGSEAARALHWEGSLGVGTLGPQGVPIFCTAVTCRIDLVVEDLLRSANFSVAPSTDEAATPQIARRSAEP